MVHVWSADGDRLLDFEFDEEIEHLHWTPECRLVVVAGATVRFLPNPLPWRDLVAEAESRRLRTLTEEERRAALLPFRPAADHRHAT